MFLYKNIILKEVTIDDIDLLYKYYEKGYLKFYRPNLYKLKIEKDFFKKRIFFFNSLSESPEREAIIFLNSKNNDIGLTSLQNIDYYNKISEFSIVLKKRINPFSSLEIIVLSLFLSFNIFDLYKIYFNVFENNTFLLKILYKRGFKPEAILQKEILYNNKRYNIYRFSIFKDEFDKDIFWKKIKQVIKFDSRIINVK